MSTVLTGSVVVAAQTLHSSSSDKLHNLGDTVFSNDGRAFRFCKAGATSLVAGTLQQSSVEDTTTQNLTAVAASVGDLSVASTTTVTITANEYAEGWVIVSVTPGVGRQYKVKGHIAYTAAAPTLNLFDSIQVALTTTSRLDLVRNPYSAVVQGASALTATPVGVAVHPITNAQYGWLQVGGVAACLADGALTVGLDVVQSNATAGAVEPLTGTTLGNQPIVGSALTGVASTEYGAIKLKGLL